jgi:hypothetical protein
MMPSASTSFTADRSASKMVSTKTISTGWSTYGRARLTAPAVPSCTCCSTNTDGTSSASRACCSTFSFRWPVT